MRVVLFVLTSWCLSVLAVAAQAPATFPARLDDLRERVEAHASDEAGAIGAALHQDATRAGQHDVASEALRLLGALRVEQERFAEARTLLSASLVLARTHGLPRREAEAMLTMSRVQASEGAADAAAVDALAALAVLEALDLPRESILWAYSQATPALAGRPEYPATLARARALLRRDDRSPVACSLWHSHGDALFNRAAYVEAHESLSTALACYEHGSKRGDAGRVLVSLGRVQRAHGQLPAALVYYRRAASLQQAAGDLPALVQSLNAQAVTYDRLGRFAAAQRLYRRAIGIARSRALERYEVFLQGNLAGSLLSSGNAAGAIRELQPVLLREKSPHLRATRLRQIAEAWRELGQDDQAMSALEQAWREVPAPTFDERVALLGTQAMVNARRGQLDAAQRDLDQAVGLVEDARAEVLTADAARRGFGDLHQSLFAVAIDVAMRRGAETMALEVAEQARARALLDLMQDERGSARATPLKYPAMQALARQLDTTLLVYWVDGASTFAWIVTAETMRGHRLAISERTLKALVHQAGGGGDVPGAINAALLGGAQLQPWRALHRAIIAPLLRDLPPGEGRRLTIVPHGPLLHLPFAGLLDARGRYLIERYALHYAPSLAVLDAATRHPTSVHSGRALVLGDPAPLPRLPGMHLPPPLPHARIEARRVARQFPDGARLAIGAAATEGSLRSALAQYGWLHVATHARVAEESTSQSYLLLARGTGEPGDDGLITADEVRALPLLGATVVLSACGTALGRITGEGTLGFTRSFLAAGARAIVATTWEMPDLAGLRMMDGFYAARRRGNTVSDALRSAQLRQLRALRAGTLTVSEGGRTVALPATPLLWAGYIAVGAP